MELEWRLAAQWAGYKYYTEFIWLPGEEQAAVVAAYRVSNWGEAAIQVESARRAQAQAPSS